MTKVVVIDLEEAGLEVAWSDLEIEVGDEVWVGVKRRYWNVGGIYRLPVCTFLG